MKVSTLTNSQNFILPLEGKAGLKVFLCFGFAYFLSYAMRAINAIIAPNLILDLGVSNTALGLLSSAYFVGFALMQLPLGVWLDKYGSRRTESILLLFSVFGAVVFSFAENILWATAGRGFVGVGVSACLMSAFTSYRRWFKPEQQGSLASGMLVFGTAGALMTTIPAQAALPYIGWRGIFILMAVLLALSALAIRYGLPKAGDPIPFIEERPFINNPQPAWFSFKWLSVYGEIFKNGFFLQMLPMGIFNQGGFMAFQTLWLGPWFRQIVGLNESQVAQTLFLFNGILLCGYIFNAWVMPRVNKAGVSTFHYSAIISGVALFVQLFAVTLGNHSFAVVAWYLFGLSATSFILGQSVIQTRFPKNIAGRAATAYNLVLFVGAFFIQWGIGGIIDLLIINDIEKPQAFTYTVYIMLTFQLVSYIWMWIAPRLLSQQSFEPMASLD